MKLSISNQENHDRMRNIEDPYKNNPELWFETIEGDITTNRKGLQRTSTLSGGWLKVYLAAHSAFNIATKTLSKWKSITEPAI